MSFDSQAYRIFSWVAVALLAVAIAVVGLQGDWTGLALLLMFFVGTIIFLLFEDRLPALFDSLFALAAVVNAAGWVWDLYTRVWGYDEFAHFYTTFAATLSLAYLLYYGMREHFSRHAAHFVIVVTSFGVTLGAWWEVAEWIFIEELNDPVNDIVLDSLGAMLAAALSLWTIRREFPSSRQVQPSFQ